MEEHKVRLKPALVAFCSLAEAVSNASAHAKLNLLYSFCSQDGCTDGSESATGLVADSTGNLYGATLFGGANGAGTVFELMPNARRTRWKYRRLYSFCSLGSCADGSEPFATPIIDTAGDLYGTTVSGGPNNGGVVYELSPNATHTKWTLSMLHAFCAPGGDCTDGRAPEAALSYAGKALGAFYDGKSPLYGTTFQAGANKQGTVYSLTRNGSDWDEKILYAFCAVSGCTDGSSPAAGVTVDADGNLFGTTYFGGAQNSGAFFELTVTAGRHLPATETVLHSFCSEANCADGAFPASEARLDLDGDLVGTTFGGGKTSGDCDDIGVSGCGVAYKIAPNGLSSQLTVLHTFCSRKNCADGAYPLAGLTTDSSGNLFGATLYGGGNGSPPGSGTVFELSTKTRALYQFCPKGDCSTGALPEGDLYLDQDGHLFGTTQLDGANGDGGTVFEIAP